MHRRKRQYQFGFTLMEMLVVIAIIGLVGAIAVPSIAAARGMAYRAECVSHLKQMGDLMQLYSIDYDGAMPALAGAGESSGSDESAGAYSYGGGSSAYTASFAMASAKGGSKGSKGGSAQVFASFSSDNLSVTATSTKDLSNVVLKFTDDVHQKFEGLSGKSKTFSGTDSNEDKQIVGVWIKSGSNFSGDGPGYGEWAGNPNELDVLSDEAPENEEESGTPEPVTVDLAGWKIFDPRVMLCGEDMTPDYIEVIVDDQTTETRPVSYGANGMLLSAGMFYEDIAKPQNAAMVFDGNPTESSAQVFDARHYEEGMVLYGDWHVGQANAMSEDMLGLE